jgi:hypothetical protein
MIVNVTGNLKLLRMTLPVLEERAEEKYHNEHKRTKRTVARDGKTGI